MVQGQTFEDPIPELFTIACKKDNWEVDAVSRFYEVLYSPKVRYGGVDTICWSIEKEGIRCEVLLSDFVSLGAI